MTYDQLKSTVLQELSNRIDSESRSFDESYRLEIRGGAYDDGKPYTYWSWVQAKENFGQFETLADGEGETLADAEQQARAEKLKIVLEDICDGGSFDAILRSVLQREPQTTSQTT